MIIEDVTPPELRGPSDEERLQAAMARIVELEAQLEATKKNLQSITPDRVARDGQVVVDAQEWTAIQQFAQVWFSGRPDEEIFDHSSAWYARRRAILRESDGGAS